ncbi:carboxyl transferase domain-containing protein [SAR92 clade bacterium H246]
MINKLLIANRGEIAIRIMRTAHTLDIKTAAIFSPDDAQSLPVKYADQSMELTGHGVAAYLDIDAVIGAAKSLACDALHPGYGLLSESAALARACADNGITFIGPDVPTLNHFGDKRSARTLAKKAGIPIIEGRDKVATVADVQQFFAEQNHQAIMIKAVNGGGGRGMRVVSTGDEIETAFTRCQAESLSAFGSDDLYVERYLPTARHIEVQILGDGHDVIHLWERDCSIQRRNQKLLELAPAPNLDASVRQQLLDAAVAIGKACNYKGLGTVEFLVAVNSDGKAGEFFFIETNPRIQVEHTITEAITGLDLVELQLRVAAGETLADMGLTQSAVPKPNGYAIQARINTETLNPQGELVPTGGTLSQLQLPTGPGVRVDTYAYSGYRTNPNFDALLAKVIVHSRSPELGPLFKATDRALSELHIGGIETNSDFLRRVLKLPAVTDWQISVRGIEAQLKDCWSESPSNDKHRFIQPATDKMAHMVESQHNDYPEDSVVIRSPLQSVFVAYEVALGESVYAGQELAVVEAMKMQHVITAECSGIVTRLLVDSGASLDADQAIILIEQQDRDDTSREDKKAIDLDTIRPDLQRLRDRIALTQDDARPEAINKRHARGQRTARENIADLVDADSFMEFGQLVYAAQRRRIDKDSLMRTSPADGIITGFASINGEQFDGAYTQTAVLSYDATVMAGTQGLLGHKKTDRFLEVANKRNVPLIFFAEGGGGRPNDSDFDDILGACLDCKTFYNFGQYRGLKITVNDGYCFAGNAVIFGCGDIKITTQQSWVGLGGPAMIEGGGLGHVSAKDIGPAKEQAKTGLIDVLVKDDREAVKVARQLLSYFQGVNSDWQAPDQRKLRHIIPEDRKRVYAMREVITSLADVDSWLELREHFGIGMITGLLRIEGIPLGLIANNPQHLGGAIDAAASEKAAEFIALCNRFKLPILSLCDTPGFMVGVDSEREGGVRWACQFVNAGAQVTVPYITLCVRKGFGLGGQAMAGGSFGTTQLTAAWPTAEFGMMGIEGGVRLGYKKELDAETDPHKRETLFNTLVERANEAGSAESVASLMELDTVIDPLETRGWICGGLQSHAPVQG